MGMSIPYTDFGRTRQKSRTRDALVAATHALIAEGKTPTVEDAAVRAEISRTTAYRYFSNQRALLIAAHPEIDRHTLLGANPPRDAAARLETTIDEFLRITLETEPQLRVALRVSLDAAQDRSDTSLRRGRAIAWIEDALAPLRGRLSDHELRSLVLAIRSAAGIEALVWLTDVAHLSRAQAVDVMKWSARALLRSAMAERKRPHTKQQPRRKRL
jgi:hypothetical protein